MQNKTKRPTALAVVGATATGKTALAIALAKALDGEIISCDSMQIYRHMDIGTAKATQSERACVPHHMLDILPPAGVYSAADYARDAMAVLLDIVGRGKLPIICGGTGLYLEALRTGRHDISIEADIGYRQELEAIARRDGVKKVHQMLADIDEDSAQAIHENNLKRVIRALEIFHVTGMTKTALDQKSNAQLPQVDLCTVGLWYEHRETLYKRIDKRVDLMFEEGLLEEVKMLKEKGFLAPNATATQAIGYRECLAYLSGDMTLDGAKEAIKQATRHYAKRQNTWFASHGDVAWLTVDTEETNKSCERLTKEAQDIFEHYLLNMQN